MQFFDLQHSRFLRVAGQVDKVLPLLSTVKAVGCKYFVCDGALQNLEGRG